MEWEFIAPMVMGVTLFLSIAGVLVFRPLTKRLGDLIEVTARNRKTPPGQEDVARLTEVVSRLADRIDQLEERQEFTERVLTSAERSEQVKLRGHGDS